MTGTVNYLNGMFLGKEELTKNQEMQRSMLLGILNIFGHKGLFDLKATGTQLRIVYDDLSQSITAQLIFPNTRTRVLGISEQGFPLVCEGSMLSISTSIARPDETSKIYICLSSTPFTKEKGMVTVSRDGTVIGTDTEFTKFLRGGKRKSRIKIGNQTFTVSSIESDTLLYLQGDNFPSLSNYPWIILPTLDPFSEEDNQALYTYDECSLVIKFEAPSERDIFQIAEINYSDIVSGVIQGISSSWFSQKTFLFNSLLPDSVGSEELKPDSVGSEELDLNVKPVKSLVVSSTMSGATLAVSLNNFLRKPSPTQNYWTVTTLQIAPSISPTKMIALRTGGFSSGEFESFPETIKFVIDRLEDTSGSGHSLTTLTLNGSERTIEFPAAASRIVICFQKNLANLKYDYLYHINCL